LALRRRPTGAGVKPPCAALADDRRGERQGEGVIRSRQVGTRKTYQKCSVGRKPVRVSLSKRRKRIDGIETGGPLLTLGMSLAGARVLARWCPAQRRREPGLRLLHGT
jgi:hypothetical protein